MKSRVFLDGINIRGEDTPLPADILEFLIAIF